MIKDFGKTAIVTMHGDVSYRALLWHIDQFAQYTPRSDKGSFSPQDSKKTIIFSENREGWIYAFFSVWRNGGIAITVDATSNAHDLAYMLNDSGAVCVWTSLHNEPVVREALTEVGHRVEVLVIDKYEQEAPPAEIPAMVSWDRDDREIAVIIYTSGTTGAPKGVMLSFANLRANIRGVSKEVEIFNSERRALILLPLHHILPLQGTMIAPLTIGGGVAIAPSMSGPDIMETLCRGRVAIFIGVPRLWQTLYNGIMKQINAKGITRALFALCAKVQSRTLSRIIFGKVHRKMGGNIQFCVSGGAALDAEIGYGLKTLGLELLEGYGMTETAPIIAFTRPGDYIPGCVGLPLPSVECKLVNTHKETLPDGSTTDVGELCAKGPNVMLGYYNRPEATEETIDAEGFIHTGDLARFDDAGRVIITGRCKEIIVLSNGKNVQPAEIEFKLEKYAHRVKEAAITQDGDLLRAIIVPEPVWARDRSDEDIEQQIKREVLEPYNQQAQGYKKIMSLTIYRGDLPRTKLDKLQRFKLKAIVEAAKNGESGGTELKIVEPDTEEYRILRDYIQGEKNIKPRPDDHIETDLAMDSLDKVGLQGFVENTFGITVNADSMAGFANIAKMAEYIAQHKTRMEVENIDWSRLFADAHASSSASPLPQTSWTLTAVSSAMIGFIRRHNSLKIIGTENIPQSGPFILAANHQSFMDAPIVVSGLSKEQQRQNYFYATEEHVRGSIRRSMANHNNIIIMEKANLKNSILKMARVLQEGKTLTIFPEGTRTRTGFMSEFKKTFAILSKELNVPIVPVRITGAFQAWPRTRRFPNNAPVQVEYLPPVLPTESDSYDSLSQRVRKSMLMSLLAIILAVVPAHAGAAKGSKASPKAAVELIKRIGGEQAAKKFRIELFAAPDTAPEQFVIGQQKGKILIKGNSLSAITTGIGWYLNHHARINIAWNSLNEKTAGQAYADLGNLPLPSSTEQHVCDAQYRYYLNYCTYGYSMTTWTWKRWQQEIDWMALHGINMPLQIIGLEEVWRRFLTLEEGSQRKYNYSDEEAKAFVAGPAFTAWWGMNNLEGWGGTSADGWGGVQDDAWYARQSALASQILSRQRELGMQPVLPGFSGMVPHDFTAKTGVPTDNNGGGWCGFVRPYIIDPTDARFADIAKDYYDCLNAVMGESQYYSMDPFHEGGSISSGKYSEAYRAVYDAMEAAKGGSQWVIQQWQWNANQKKSVSAVPEGKLIVLDLFSDGSPAFDGYNGYAPQHSVFCAIPNFGGRSGVMGRLQNVTDNYFKFKAKYPSIKGIGAAPEAIEQTPVTYDLIFELCWLNGKKPDMTQWISEYATYRYGQRNAKAQEAWRLLLNSAFNYGADGIQGPVEDVWAARPNLEAWPASTWGVTINNAGGTYTADKREMLVRATKLLLSIAPELRLPKGSVAESNYYYDIVELTSAVMADYAYDLLKSIKAAKEAAGEAFESDATYRERRDLFLSLIAEVDALKGSNLNFRLGKWTQEARDAAAEVKGATSATPDWYEFNNARTLITTWGDQSQNVGLKDYSYRSWQGLMKDYYLPRWQYYFDHGCQGCDYFYFEWNWAHGMTHHVGDTQKSSTRLTPGQAGYSYSRTPEGNPVEIAQKLINERLTTDKSL